EPRGANPPPSAIISPSPFSAFFLIFLVYPHSNWICAIPALRLDPPSIFIFPSRCGRCRLLLRQPPSAHVVRSCTLL
ncbi:hypothetical protein AOQ84DRAFT_385213, partial [Glonium stellatum]